jgi:hypothetical protein
MKNETYKLLKAISQNRRIGDNKLEKLGFKWKGIGDDRSSAKWASDSNIVQLLAIKLICDVGSGAHPEFEITLAGETFLQQGENNILNIRASIFAGVAAAVIGALMTIIGQIVLARYFPPKTNDLIPIITQGTGQGKLK